jgi:hypothetical protein
MLSIECIAVLKLLTQRIIQFDLIDSKTAQDRSTCCTASILSLVSHIRRCLKLRAKTQARMLVSCVQHVHILSVEVKAAGVRAQASTYA